MTEKEFCYWLRGFFEITGDDVLPILSQDQIKTIKSHLELVFTNVTKSKTTHTYCGYLDTNARNNFSSSIKECNILNTKHTGDWKKPLC